MTINDLKSGQKVTIIAFVKGKSLEFPTTILDKKNDLLMLNPIMRSEKCVSFKGIPVGLMIEVEDDQPYLFASTPLTILSKKGKTFYATKITVPAKKYNRRNSFRCFVGAPVNIMLDSNRKTFKAYLKDVSATGFSITMEENDLPNDYEESKSISLTYNEFMEEIFYQANLRLSGDIVRIYHSEENQKVVFGCAFTSKNILVEKYIAAKERVRMKKKTIRYGQ